MVNIKVEHEQETNRCYHNLELTPPGGTFLPLSLSAVHVSLLGSLSRPDGVLKLSDGVPSSRDVLWSLGLRYGELTSSWCLLDTLSMWAASFSYSGE